MKEQLKRFPFYMAYIAGCDAGYAWIEVQTGKRRKVIGQDGMSARVATYSALGEVARMLPEGCEAFVFTHDVVLRRDYQRLCVYDQIIVLPFDVRGTTIGTINSRRLKLHVEKVRPSRNPALKFLLERKSDADNE
jgi:hypothetical protein